MPVETRLQTISSAKLRLGRRFAVQRTAQEESHCVLSLIPLDNSKEKSIEHVGVCFEKQNCSQFVHQSYSENLL